MLATAGTASDSSERWEACLEVRVLPESADQSNYCHHHHSSQSHGDEDGGVVISVLWAFPILTS